jgi:hypothetical protein
VVVICNWMTLTAGFFLLIYNVVNN